MSTHSPPHCRPRARRSARTVPPTPSRPHSRRSAPRRRPSPATSPTIRPTSARWSRRSSPASATSIEEAVVDGELVNLAEYQDAYGFTLESRDRYDAIAGEVESASAEEAAEISESFDRLEAAMPSGEPPANPAPLRGGRGSGEVLVGAELEETVGARPVEGVPIRPPCRPGRSSASWTRSSRPTTARRPRPGRGARGGGLPPALRDDRSRRDRRRSRDERRAGTVLGAELRKRSGRCEGGDRDDGDARSSCSTGRHGDWRRAAEYATVVSATCLRSWRSHRPRARCPARAAVGTADDAIKELDVARAGVAESVEHYQEGDADEAYTAARNAYLDHFEYVEIPLRVRDEA